MNSGALEALQRNPITFARMMSGHPANAQERSAGADELRSAAEWVVPTSPAEAGAMAMFGPFGKLAKMSGLGAMLGGYGTDVDAAGMGALLRLFHGGQKLGKWDPSVPTVEGPLSRGLGLYAAEAPEVANMYKRLEREPGLTELMVRPEGIFNPTKMEGADKQAYMRALMELDKLGLDASRKGLRNSLFDAKNYDPAQVREALIGSGINGFSSKLGGSLGDEFEIFNPESILEYVPRDYKKGGKVEAPMWGALKKMGFSDEAISDRQQEYMLERNKGYIGQGMTNAEFNPGTYLEKPDKIMPYGDWLDKVGYDTGGYHSAMEGIVVPDRHPGYPIGEVLAHEGQHKRETSLPPEEFRDEGRQAAQKGVLENLMKHVEGKRVYPNAITGRKMLGEVAPELIGHESYLPAGQSLIKSPLGRAVLQTPEQKLWYMSRRHPRVKDIDAITGASPE